MVVQPQLKSADERRDEILEAALAEVSERGLHGASAEGKRGLEALEAMGDAYEKLLVDRTRLRAQMQAYAACDDTDIREVVRNGYGDIVAYVERVSGLPPEDVTRFFATGMLLNVMASMDLWESPEAWSQRLLAGCKEET